MAEPALRRLDTLVRRLNADAEHYTRAGRSGPDLPRSMHASRGAAEQAWADELWGILDELSADAARARLEHEALERINDVRNSIVGSQAPNWSLHVYPLVAFLEAVGIEGLGYEAVRQQVDEIDARIRANEKLANDERVQRDIDAELADDVAPTTVGGTDA